MKKTYLKSRPVCKVRFELPKAAVDGASKVAVVPASCRLPARREDSSTSCWAAWERFVAQVVR